MIASVYDSNISPVVPSPVVPSSNKKRIQIPQAKKMPTPKTKAYIKQFPHHFQCYINPITYVVPDGNCGFRCVVALLEKDEDE